MDAAISVQNVSKTFRTYNPEKPNTIAELVVKGAAHLRAEDQFWALRDVSFDIGHGRMLGVIGKNGAGKSTLLRLIGGVGRPDRAHGVRVGAAPAVRGPGAPGRRRGTRDRSGAREAGARGGRDHDVARHRG